MKKWHFDMKRLLAFAAGMVLIFTNKLSQAQLQDQFDDNEFTSNPAWTGNTENFIVNTSGQLQLNDFSPVVTQSHLTTPCVLANLQSKEWHLHAKHTFSGSDSNQGRIYFAADAPATGYTGNASAGVHGYYLKLGEALSADVVRIYRDDATSITLLASTTTDISASFEIGIRITHLKLAYALQLTTQETGPLELIQPVEPTTKLKPLLMTIPTTHHPTSVSFAPILHRTQRNFITMIYTLVKYSWILHHQNSSVRRQFLPIPLIYFSTRRFR